MRRRFSTLLLASLLVNLSALAETPKTTQQVLEQVGDDILSAWTEFPKDNQKSVREAKITDLNTSFTKDIAKAEAPPNLTVEKSLANCISNIAKTKVLLKFDNMQQDRTVYLNCCSLALRRELPLTTDYKNPRTTQQCFDLMLDMFATAHEKLHVYSADIQQTAFTAINTAIAELLRTATVPEKPDKNVQMDLNIKEARKRFPTSTPDLEKANRTVVMLLEATARTIQQMERKK